MSDTQETVNRLQRLEAQYADLAAKDGELNRHVGMTISALESPAAPAPDPVCQCGFPYDGKCMRRDCPGVGSECANCGHQLVDGSCVNCSYVPAEQPALDPGFRIAIREAVVRMAALNVTVQEVDDITDAVIHTMRTYGRDGAR